MSKYFYNITGEYGDMIIIKRGEEVVHDGSLLGLVSYTNERLELGLNFGAGYHSYIFEIKKLEELIIVVPIPELLFSYSSLCYPIVFNIKEFNYFIEINYLDENLFKNIREINKEDMYNFMLLDFKHKFNIKQSIVYNDIVENIVFASSFESELNKCIIDMKGNKSINLINVEQNNEDIITLYISLFDKIYEWDEIKVINNQFYLRIYEDYKLDIF